MNEYIPTIIKQLERELATAIAASEDARSSATHSENIADNRYDTLALEAAYLAYGQSARIEELQESINLYKRFRQPDFTQQSSIQLGALVDIESNSGDIQRLFIGPAAGGLCIEEKPQVIRVITTTTPLGQALLHRTIDEEFGLIINQQSLRFTIIDIQ